MAIWKVTTTRTKDDGSEEQITRCVRADRRQQVESYLLQAFSVERVRNAEDMAALRDVEIEQTE